MTHCAIAGLVCVCISVAGYADSKVVAGTILGVNHYWQNSEVVSGPVRGSNQYIDLATMSFDTVNFDTCALRIGVLASRKVQGVSAACGLFASSQKAIFGVKNPCAMTIPLLAQLGYDILVLSQWNCLPEGEQKVVSAGMSKEVKPQRIMSDYVWESVERSVLESPTTMHRDYYVNIYFHGYGYSRYEGKEDFGKSFQQQLGAGDGLVVRFNPYEVNGGNTQFLTTRRRIYAVYIVAAVDQTAANIIAKLENEMDKMKLDLSYKMPTIKKIECK